MFFFFLLIFLENVSTKVSAERVSLQNPNIFSTKIGALSRGGYLSLARPEMTEKKKKVVYPHVAVEPKASGLRSEPTKIVTDQPADNSIPTRRETASFGLVCWTSVSGSAKQQLSSTR